MCAGSVVFPFEGAPGAVTVGLRPEHLTFTGSGLSGRVAQLEPMGREILYVVDTDAGYLRVLEHGSIAAHAVGEPVMIGFSPDDSLVSTPQAKGFLPPRGWVRRHDAGWRRRSACRPGSSAGANGHRRAKIARYDSSSLTVGTPLFVPLIMQRFFF